MELILLIFDFWGCRGLKNQLFELILLIFGPVKDPKNHLFELILLILGSFLLIFGPVEAKTSTYQNKILF